MENNVTIEKHVEYLMRWEDINDLLRKKKQAQNYILRMIVSKRQYMKYMNKYTERKKDEEGFMANIDSSCIKINT